MSAYVVGNVARLRAEFEGTISGQLADPSTVTLDLITPAGVRSTLEAEVVREGVGLYHYDLVLAEHGAYHYRFGGTGDVIAAGWRTLVVQRSPFD